MQHVGARTQQKVQRIARHAGRLDALRKDGACLVEPAHLCACARATDEEKEKEGEAWYCA